MQGDEGIPIMCRVAPKTSPEVVTLAGANPWQVVGFLSDPAKCSSKSLKPALFTSAKYHLRWIMNTIGVTQTKTSSRLVKPELLSRSLDKEALKVKVKSSTNAATSTITESFTVSSVATKSIVTKDSSVIVNTSTSTSPLTYDIIKSSLIINNITVNSSIPPSDNTSESGLHDSNSSLANLENSNSSTSTTTESLYNIPSNDAAASTAAIPTITIKPSLGPILDNFSSNSKFNSISATKEGVTVETNSVLKSSTIAPSTAGIITEADLIVAVTDNTLNVTSDNANSLNAMADLLIGIQKNQTV